MVVRQWLRRLRAGAWSGWPEQAYKQERYQQRLTAVERHLAEGLDLAPPGAVRILSMCAGDGRDVIGALVSHPRRKDAAAWLVELNRQSVAVGARHAASAGLENSVHFLNKDATDYSTYKGLAPADSVLVCGVWGHVPSEERALLVRAMAAFCKPGGTVIWTRGVAKGMSRLHEIQSLFAGSSWEKIRVSVTRDEKWAIATYRSCGPAAELPATGRIFHFKKRRWFDVAA